MGKSKGVEIFLQEFYFGSKLHSFLIEKRATDGHRFMPKEVTSRGSASASRYVGTLLFLDTDSAFVPIYNIGTTADK